MTIHKILKYLALVIGVIGLILLGRIIMTYDDAIESSAATQQSVVTPFLWLAYIVMAVILVLVIFFVIKGLFRGNIKNTLISVGAFLLIVAVAYVLSDGTQKTLKDGEILSASTDHWVGA
ncbi:hypothetical protein [Antarcticibacterium sp. 1MA-6-2]|uniref:hypothetical protein n=1 Tax=Antarcticibacterium sp. 1MA-6-2 TaxID=2908210 RepID=UPI002883369C|nr:hypothetical protein [Antarcticibacterium sp. 1MA-6-2]